MKFFRKLLRLLGYRRPFKGQRVLYASELVLGHLPEDRRFEMPIVYRRSVNVEPLCPRESFRGKVRFDHDIEPTGGATLTTGPSA